MSRLGDIAFASLSLGILAQLGACASRPIEETPLESQRDEIADISGEAVSGETQSVQMDAAPEETSAIAKPRASRPTRVARDEQNFDAPVAYSRSRAPKIAAAPFQSEGHWMNAFYFVRTDGESWETISQKLYSRSDRAEMLKKWNKGKALGASAVVYYNSPFRPEDSTAMKVFAEDFGAKLETVTVQSGDWLSKIGQARYGDVRTWVEIAGLNPEIASPDRIEIGQTLRVQPVQVNTQAALEALINQVAKSAETPDSLPDPSADQAAIEEPTNPEPPIAALDEAPPMPDQLEQPVAEERPTKTAQGPPAWKKMVQDKLPLIAGGIALVLVGLVIFRRLKTRREQAELAQLAQVTSLVGRSKTGSDA